MNNWSNGASSLDNDCDLHDNTWNFGVWLNPLSIIITLDVNFRIKKIKLKMAPISILKDRMRN